MPEDSIMPDQPSYFVKKLLVLVAVLLGIIVALITGILANAGGAGLSSVIASSGVGFGSSVPLALCIEKALGLL
jgi:hypothetical protein